jgi:uncharacterized membrane protein YkvA (DUF1232 family)
MLKSRIAARARNKYVRSTIQLIPSFIPFIGQKDDLFVVAVGTALVSRMADPQLLLECSLGGT